MAFTILIIDDEKEMCLSLAEIFQREGYKTVSSTNPLAAVELLARNKIDLILMDIKMPEMSGIDLLKQIRLSDSNIPIFMITGFSSVESAVKAMKYGATDYLEKPLNVKKFLEKVKIIQHSMEKKNWLSEDFSIIGQNKVISELKYEIKKAAPTKAPVHIYGESGTGKELVASEIHRLSLQKIGNFVKVNCASIPDSLLESELFGYEKGAFTDAKSRHVGYFEQANGGSIFLDEIGDMSIKTQPKILRVLQDGEIQRLGSVKNIYTDARIISATNQNLETLIEEKIFRQDLYYRFSVVTLRLPPLRKRRDDISILTNHFISHFNKEYNKKISFVSTEVKSIFENHTWPGNIRELKNCLERAVIFAESDCVDLEHLPSQYREMINSGNELIYKSTMDSLSKEMILDALKQSNGVKQIAAEKLNIHRKTLYNRMKKLGLK